jgi:CrcB protein
VAWSLARGSFEAETRAILTAGVLGGFTTYSSFNQEALELWNRGASGWLALHVGMTVVGCLVAGALGGALGRAAATP